MSSRRIVVVGAMGRMGRMVREAIGRDPELAVGGTLERQGHPELGSDVDGTALSDDPKTAISCGDVAIDFSIPDSTLINLQVASDLGVAYVTGTTGFSDEERRELENLAERTPVIAAPNFSVAVNVLVHLVREATRRLGPDYDAELVELHHAAKRDAPSGTALRLAEAVAEARGQTLADHLVLERAGETGARPPGTIGIQTLRAGDSVGEHSVFLVGKGERLELVHRAHTRDHFARGAIRAALWLAERGPGLYPFEDVLGL